MHLLCYFCSKQSFFFPTQPTWKNVSSCKKKHISKWSVLSLHHQRLVAEWMKAKWVMYCIGDSLLNPPPPFSHPPHTPTLSCTSVLFKCKYMHTGRKKKINSCHAPAALLHWVYRIRDNDCWNDSGAIRGWFPKLMLMPLDIYLLSISTK